MRCVLRRLLLGLALALLAPAMACVGSPQPEPPTGGPKDAGQGGVFDGGAAVDASPGFEDAGGAAPDAGAAVDGGDATPDGGVAPGPVVPRLPPGLPTPGPEPVELPPEVLAPPDAGS